MAMEIRYVTLRDVLHSGGTKSVIGLQPDPRSRFALVVVAPRD